METAMSTRDDWHTRPETGVFLRALLQGFWQRGLLVHLADMPPEQAAHGFFPPCPERFPAALPLDRLLQEHSPAARLLCSLPTGHPLTDCLRLLCEGQELAALEGLMALGQARINGLPSRLAGAMLCFLAARLHRLPLPSEKEQRRFLPLCRDVHTFAVCTGHFVPALVPLCLRARACAIRLRDRDESILFDLLAGSLNVCNTEQHNNPHLHALMERGKQALEAARDPVSLRRPLPIWASTISSAANTTAP